jgi:NADPH:quinone reductase-like Zn-dependent oxidoreductase
MNIAMKAIVYTKYGSPDVLQLKDVEKPLAADNEALIKVHATTAEAADAIFWQGNDFLARLFTGLLKPKFTTPGSEFAGKLKQLAILVIRYKVGDRVIGAAAPSSGADYICRPDVD